MTPAKIREHEPTAVKRDSSNQNIGETRILNPEDARERARRSRMTKGTLGAVKAGDNMNKEQLEQISN